MIPVAVPLAWMTVFGDVGPFGEEGAMTRTVASRISSLMSRRHKALKLVGLVGDGAAPHRRSRDHCGVGKAGRTADRILYGALGDGRDGRLSARCYGASDD